MTLFIGFIAALIVLLLVVIHIGFRAPRIAEKSNPDDFGMSYKEIIIPTIKGKKLFAWQLYPSNNLPPALSSLDTQPLTLLIMHGWGGNAEMMLPLAEPFYKAGINILLFDARNHGQSSTDGHSSMPKFAQDIGFVIDWLKTQQGAKTGKIALLGHSVGAAAVLLAASKRRDIDAVISISSFAHPRLMMQRQMGKIPFLSSLIPVILGYIEWVIGHRFDDIAPINSICSVKCPVLLVHGEDDETIPLDDMRAIEKHCSGSKPDILPDILIVEGAGHASIDKISTHADELIEFLLDKHQGTPA